MSEQKKCMKCNSPWQYKVVKIVKGKVFEYLLCEKHAQEVSPTLRKKKQVDGPEPPDLLHLIQHFLGHPAEGSEPQQPETGPVCSECGLSFSQYRKTLLLGCNNCYNAFRTLLLKDLRKFHGAVSQDAKELPVIEPSESAGLIPKSELAKEKKRMSQSPLDLHKELTRAIEREDFEAAARIRDKLRSLGDAPKHKQKTSE